MSRPNILLLIADDHRHSAIGALGQEAVDTPTFDRLMAQGTTFTRASIMGATSDAVCLPSRAMLHTGRSLYRLQGQGQTIPSDHAMLGETLRRAGYDTFGTGKWHNSTEPFVRSFSHGAEIYFGGMGDHWNVPVCDFDPSGRYEGRIPQTTDFRAQSVSWRRGDHMRPGVHSTEVFADAVIHFLRGRRPGDAPFFAYLSFLAPHDPRTMPPEFLEMYPPAEIELPPSFRPEHPFDNGELRVRDELLAGFPRGEDEVREHLAAYYAMISHVDAHTGRVLHQLERAGLAEDTLVVFAGDNGLAVGRHGLLGKQSLYEHSVRVPLIFAGPGIPAAERRSALACLTDIFPTLCELTGVERPDSVEAPSLAPCLADGKASVRDHALFAYRHFMRGVRDTAGNKLIETAAAGQRHTQLFDLAADPFEIRDLSRDPARADTLSSLRRELTQWPRDLGDDQEGQGGEFWEQMEWAR